MKDITQKALEALHYAAANWHPMSLKDRLALEGATVSIPDGEPTIIGHNTNLQYDHHWAGGCNRLEMLDDALRKWNSRVWDDVRYPFLLYFKTKIEEKNEVWIDFWGDSVYTFLRNIGKL
jgi:hypothetical protein